MAQILNSPLPQHQNFRLGVRPQVWKCGNDICKNLVSDVDRKSKFKKYCSIDCRNYVNDNRRRERKNQIKKPRHLEPKPCEYCGKSFRPRTKSTTKYCSRKCNWRALRGIVINKKCLHCKKSIEHLSNRKYCSVRCKLIHYHLSKLKELGV